MWVTGLKSLTMIGHFPGELGRKLHEFLFTAIQAHLSSFEQLTVLDGQSAGAVDTVSAGDWYLRSASGESTYSGYATRSFSG